MTRALIIVLALMPGASLGCWSRLGHAEPIDVPADESAPDFSLPPRGKGLEFRVLANEVDDQEAIAETIRLINRADAMKEELDELQLKGLPPPGPRHDNAKENLKEFTIRLAAGKSSRLTYEWLELGPSKRVTLDLHNAAKDDALRNRTWNDAARSRGQASQLRDFHGPGNLLRGALFYSRECKNQNLPEPDRDKKAVDYFVLARNPEIDTDGRILPRGKPKAITGKYLTEVSSTPPGETPSILFSVNDLGGKLLHELTERNVPSPGHKRHLALIVNGMVVSAPAINSPIRNDGSITFPSGRKQLEELVVLMQANMSKKKQ